MNDSLAPDHVFYGLNNSQKIIYHDFDFEGGIELEVLIEFASLSYNFIQDQIEATGARKVDPVPQKSVRLHAEGYGFDFWLKMASGASQMISYWTLGDSVLTLVKFADKWREHGESNAPFASVDVFDNDGYHAAGGYLAPTDAAATDNSITIMTSKASTSRTR